MDQTSSPDGTAVPTPPLEMSSTDSAPAETRPASLALIESALGRSFDSEDQAAETLRNLNSLVGDQATAKQRKALSKLAEQSGLSVDELIEVVETQESPAPQEQPQAVASAPTLPDQTTARLTRIEVNDFVRENPEASLVRDQLFAEAASSGRPVTDIWAKKFAPMIEAGKKIGAKKLQSALEGQPTRATSTTEGSDTKVDFHGVNPETGKRWTSKEMERFIGVNVA